MSPEHVFWWIVKWIVAVGGGTVVGLFVVLFIIAILKEIVSF